MQSHATLREIRRQPDTWKTTWEVWTEKRASLLQFFRERQPESILFTGCGTSYYLSIAAARLFQEQTGIPAQAVPASEIMIQPTAFFPPDRPALLVASSRSGETSEVVRAVNVVQERRLAPSLAITGEPASQLAQSAGFALALPHIREQSVVMTSSFTNLLFSLQLWTAIVAGNEDLLRELRQVPALGEKHLSTAEDTARQLGAEESFTHFVYLGLGAYYGLACEGMLKMKEMTQTFCEAFNPLEFRHGPISTLNRQSRVFLLKSRVGHPHEQALVLDLQQSGADVTAIGEQAGTLGADRSVELPPGLGDGSRSILYLPFLQLLAYYRTLQLKQNPDQPRNLGQVVRLNDKGGD